MRRSLFLMAMIGIAVLIAVVIADRPGEVQFTWQGYVIETSVGILLLIVAALMGVAALTYRFWRGMINAPGTLLRARSGSRRESGYRALTNGMVAVAAGDPDAARRFAKKADSLLDDPPLTMLLSAQAAQLTGDEQAATRYFEAMLERRETEFLGLRGLINQAMKRDDRVGALSLVDRARSLRPNTPWVHAAAFDLEVRQRKWGEALTSLASAVKSGAIDAATGRRHKAAILIERSREAEAAGDGAAAMEHAHKATGLMPGFTPAVVREVRLLARAGKAKQAIRLLEKAWSQKPHPSLAEMFLEAAPADETALDRVQRLDRLHRLNPDSPELLPVLAEASLAAELWGSARGHLMKALRESPSRRIYRLLSELELGEHDDAVKARNWLAKAEGAPEDPSWVCGSCGTAHALWAALCRHCGGFDTLEWRASAAPQLAAPASKGPTPIALAPPPAPGRQ